MFKLKTLFIFILCMSIGFASVITAYADTSDGILSKSGIGISFDVSAYTKYLWRGFTIDTDPVVQPNIKLSYKGLSINWWGNFDMDNTNGTNSDEMDYTVDYTKGFGKFSLSLGHIYYDFTGIGTFSREIYIGGTINTFLSPSITLYHDYGNPVFGGSGQYLIFGIGHDIPFKVKGYNASLSLSSKLAYNRKLYIKGNGGHYDLNAVLKMPLASNVTFSPSIGVSVPFGALKNPSDGNQKTRAIFGFNLGYNF